MNEERRPRQRVEAGGVGPMGKSGMSSIGKPGQKAKDFKGTFKRLSGYFLPHRYRLLLVLGTAILGTLFTIVAPKILGLATTRLFAGVLANYRAQQNHQPLPGLDFTYIGIILLVLLGLYLLSAIFMFVQQYVMAAVVQKTVCRLRTDVDEKLARLPLKFFDAHPHGEILSRAVNDMDSLSSTLQQSVTQMITSAVTILGVLIMMLTISWQLSLIVLGTLPLSMVISMVVARRSRNYFRQQQKALGKLNGYVEEIYTGHRVVRAFGHEARAIATFTELNEQLYKASWRAQFVSGIIMPLMLFIGNLAYVAIAVVGSVLVAGGGIAIGDVLAFIQYAQQFTQPIAMLANIANVIQSSMASAERIFELLDEPEELPDVANDLIAAELQGVGLVQFRHVRFGYQPDQILMDDLNIDIRTGQKVAIVGPTGAGKTTLVNLLLRFYEIQAGQIQVDGVDITRRKRSTLRRTFGMVLQDAWLFSNTIRQNIAYGHENATEEEIVHAAQAAHADHFIRTLPESYQTVLNEEATNISQGQKQLLTIARAFLADPEILILDEATSSVDTRTEQLIQKAMSRLMQGRTSFVIAHRLSTIRDADLILVMDHGTIIEQGTHQELLARKAFYARLYNSQFRGRAVAEEATL
ncbi:MAG: ABC transporter ATP-binding protein [Ktedonobacteraceae bacterium]|nr:ABC transporter ATP-binding protein [Ktedonobacteraceae bacterium]